MEGSQFLIEWAEGQINHGWAEPPAWIPKGSSIYSFSLLATLGLVEEMCTVVESSLQAGGAGWRLPMCAGLLLLTIMLHVHVGLEISEVALGGLT